MKVQNTWKSARDARNSRLARVFATPTVEAPQAAERISHVFGYETVRKDRIVEVRRPLVAPRIDEISVPVGI